MSSRTPQRPVAMVTGPTSGIGLEFARQLAGRGHDLVLVARDRSRLDAVAKELGNQGAHCEVLVADLTDRGQLAAVEARLAEGVDLLVNNAGFGLKHRFLENTVDQEQAHLDVLVVAVMRLSHAALGPMVARGSGGLINVSSVAAFLPRGTYSAAKAWVNSFGDWAHHEYAEAGVRVTTLCPGFTKTEFHERMSVGRGSAPDFMWLEPDRLVRDCLSDFDKGRAFSVPGAQYKTVAALTRAIPTSILQRFQGMGRK